MSDLSNFQKVWRYLDNASELVGYEAGLYGHGGDVAQAIQDAFNAIEDAKVKVADLGWPESE